MPTCRCARCRELFVVDEVALGKKTECPHCNNLVYVPGKARERQDVTPPPGTQTTTFYFKVKDVEKGPYTLGQLSSMWDNGQIAADAVH